MADHPPRQIHVANIYDGAPRPKGRSPEACAVIPIALCRSGELDPAGYSFVRHPDQTERQFAALVAEAKRLELNPVAPCDAIEIVRARN
jgi:hypothetical protein